MKRALLAVITIVGLAGCGPSTTSELASGPLQSGGWSAVTYTKPNEGVCLEIRATDHESEAICGLAPDDSVVWELDPFDSGESYLAGTIDLDDATSIRATFADDTRVSVPALVDRRVSPVRFYVVPIPAGSSVERLDFVDVDGSVVGSTPID